MTESTEGSSTPGVAEPGAFSRLVGVLFAPGKTFASIGRKPGYDWMLPVAILIVMTVVGVSVVNPKLDTDTAMKQTMQRIEARQPMTDAQREKTEKMVAKQYGFAKSRAVLFIAPFIVLIPLFLVPAFYLGVSKAMGAAAKYGTILAGYAFCQVPQIIKGAIGFIVAAPRDSIDLNEVEHIVRSNVGSFLDAETTSKPLMALMNQVDLFEIWGVVIGSIMLARVTKLSRNAATVTVVSIWLLWVLLKFCGAALGSAFGG
jgi:hypothetical protein